MPSFKSMDEMHAYIDSQMAKSVQKDVVKSVSQKIKKLLEDWVMSTVYENSHYAYERTFEFLDSITIGNVTTAKGVTSCEIYFDADKINQTLSKNTKWNSHMSVYGYKNDESNGQPINEMIPYYLEYGTESPVYSHDENKFLESTRKELERGYFADLVKDYLRSNGINVL